MLDPRDLLVYVVGIERCAGGSGWDLPGPVNDALDFAEWLMGRGVPPQNIQAFLARLEPGDPLTSRPHLKGKIRVRGATAAEIYDALDKELRDALPGHFCLFWGGHGCTTEDNHRWLFGAEATMENAAGIDITDFARYLGTEALGPSPPVRSRQFITIVDACATYPHILGLERSLPVRTFPRPKQVSRSQCALYATNFGEEALNPDKTGLFSRALLKRLKERPATRDLLVDLEQAGEELRHQFLNAPQNGDRTPIPAFYSSQPFNDDPHTVGNPDPAAVVHSRVARYTIIPHDLRQLFEILTESNTPIPPTAALLRQFHLANTVAEPAPRSTSDLDCLLECARRLARKSGDQLFTFLELCGPLFNDQAVRESLDQWQRNLARRLGRRVDRAHERARNADTAASPQIVQLIVDPVFGYSPGDEHYQIRAAVSPADAADPADIMTLPVSPVVAPKQLADFMRSALSEALLHVKSFEGLRIEAVLPAELLPSGAGDWILRWGPDREHISSRYAFAVRSHERGYHEDYRGPLILQKDKWRRLAGCLTEANVTWSDNLGALDEVASRQWQDPGTFALFALHFSSDDPKRRARAAQNLVCAGIPVGIWFREPLLPANGWQQFLKEYFMTQPCAAWPPRALEFHSDRKPAGSPPCTGLVLFWDNPEQPLPHLPGRSRTPLQAPS